MGTVVTVWLAVWLISDNYLGNGVTLRSTSGTHAAFVFGVAMVAVGAGLVLTGRWAARAGRVAVGVLIGALALAGVLFAGALAAYPRPSPLSLVAVDAATGRTLWRSTLPATWASSITTAGDHIEVAAAVAHGCGEDFVIFEVSARDGRRLSTHSDAQSTVSHGPFLSGTEPSPDPMGIMPTPPTLPGLRLDGASHRIISARGWSRSSHSHPGDETPVLITPAAIYLGEQGHNTVYCSR